MEALAIERTLTELDHVRLLKLVRRDRRADASSSLPPPGGDIDDVLANAAVVPSREVAPDVVTMGSQLLLQDLETGRLSQLSLRYPSDAEPASGGVSVLSPVGSSLLGLRVGGVARWSTPVGGERAAKVVAILFQPEGSGDYAM